MTGAARNREIIVADPDRLGRQARLPRPGEPGGGRVWARVARTLLDRIERGEYAGRLPGRAALVAEFGVSEPTIVRVVAELARRGAVYRVPGLGYHIADGGGQHDSPGPAVADEPGDPRAWVRVAGAIRDRIADGDLKPWDLVPSRGVLCQEYGCSRSPATHALMTLEREGVIQRIPGIGYRVAGTHRDTP